MKVEIVKLEKVNNVAILLGRYIDLGKCFYLITIKEPDGRTQESEKLFHLNDALSLFDVKIKWLETQKDWV